MSSHWDHLSPFHLRFLFPFIIVTILINALMLVVPVFSLQVFDRVLSSESVATLKALLVITLFLLLIQGVLSALRDHLAQRNALRFEVNMSDALYREMLGTEKHKRGLLNDLHETRSVLMSSAFISAFDLPFAPVFLVILQLLHPVLGAIGLVSVVVILVMTLLTAWLQRDHHLALQLSQGEVRQYQEEMLAQSDNVRVQGMRDAVLATWLSKSQMTLWYLAALSASHANMQAFNRGLRMVMQVVVMAAGALLVIQGELGAGGMIAASILLGRLLQPFEQLISGYRSLRTGYKAYCRVKVGFFTQSSEADKVMMPDPQGQLVLNKVTWLCEKSQRTLLSNIQFRLEASHCLGLVGPSGAGKSSLCDLIAGVTRATRGEVRLDGGQIENWPESQRTTVVGYLPQHIQFIAASIADNISHLSRGKGEDVQLIEAAQRAGAHELICQLPQGYDTVIGEGGYPLSGGQRQKIALARAIYFKPRLLILDEPDAYLDTDGEAQLVQLLSWCKQQGMTVIVVTHKSALLRLADWAILLQQGQIAKAGTVQHVCGRLQPQRGGSVNSSKSSQPSQNQGA
ncbi:type I secretion system permease/ATPase [Thaumasiovibrio subtropicus]|uniref:type I secretion system permease/ATPase n=1 Tax=Thaumasiovibrio subtropicus TaxID=1891207 RepID=UPI000B35E950|nr:ATP-binding cassette domain-containing protein [Thaumasiovibrio subtropicus]